ncbi:MAG: nuclear transport factor 2 family protein, partial [Mycobacterium sp.]
MTTPLFSRDELAAAFQTFEATVARAAETRDWDAWVLQYTPDVEYIEHAAGTMHGRDEVREWISRTMGSFPGSHMVAFPSLWSVIDEPTGRIIMELDNPMRDPGDGTVIGATNISIITYAGDGLW